jgi:protein O-GlcNAc transferase
MVCARRHSDRGVALEARGRLEEATEHYHRALGFDPNYAIAHGNLGRVTHRQGHIVEAIAHYRRALELDPSLADAWSNLGCAMQSLGRSEEAIPFLQRALEIQPTHDVALINLADVLRGIGKTADAIKLYDQSLAARPANWGVRVKRALTLPVVLADAAEANHYRERILRELDELEHRGARLTDPNAEVGFANFYLAYHGYNDAAIQARIARFYMKACANLAWTAPHCRTPMKRSRLKIGIASAHLCDHTVGKLYLGIVQKLSRERFEVVVMRPGARDDAATQAIGRAADRAIDLPLDLFEARKMVAREELDVLFYPDIGMGSLTYFLAFARLAPVQCVGWGHPVTTGIPTIDYFISARDLEPDDAVAHYTERLIQLEHLPVCYPRPDHVDQPLTREELGVPADATLYLCPQSVFKFHPDFDIELATLLRRDQSACLLLISGHHRDWSVQLGARIAKAFPEVADRVLFIPRVSQTIFPRLLKSADVLLDPPYFGGGNTTYEAFAAGLPIVTWPGPFMRGRVTAACYQRMGVRELIADSMESYVDLALRTAHDREFSARARAAIANTAGVLFDDLGAVRELEQFFSDAVEANAHATAITSWGAKR